MKKPVSLLLIVLVILASVVVWEDSERTRLTAENTSLKRDLDDAATRLRRAESEVALLRDELNETREELIRQRADLTAMAESQAKLEEQIRSLQEEVEQLRVQLKVRNFITVGLSFFWNPIYDLDGEVLAQIVISMNTEIWEPFEIYYFTYHAEPLAAAPAKYACAGTEYEWMTTVSRAYSGPDIPVILADITVDYAGCAHSLGAGRALVIVEPRYFLTPCGDDSRYPPVWCYSQCLLTHELLHAIAGVSDERIDQEIGTGPTSFIPIGWKSMLQAAARKFQMTPPV